MGQQGPGLIYNSRHLFFGDDLLVDELLNELREVRREIDSIPKKWEFIVLAIVFVLVAIGVMVAVLIALNFIGLGGATENQDRPLAGLVDCS